MLKADIYNLKIHIVDDNDFMLDIAKTTLNRMGIWQISTSNTGKHLLSLLDKGAYYNILLLDLNMPFMSGIDVIVRLADRKFSEGIIIYSSENSLEIQRAVNIATARSLNILGAITKPSPNTLLYQMLEKYLQASKSIMSI